MFVMKPVLLLAVGDRDLIEKWQVFLGTQGYAVELASDGEECRAKLSRVAPAVLFLDQDVPWDAASMLAALRQDPEAPRVPVVVLAGDLCSPALTWWLDPPTVACLSKSAKLETLAVAILVPQLREMVHVIRTALAPEPEKSEEVDQPPCDHMLGLFVPGVRRFRFSPPGGRTSGKSGPVKCVPEFSLRESSSLYEPAMSIP